MALSQPYPGITPPYTGNVTETQDTLNGWVERMHRAGIQVNCHANGDVAIDMMLTAVERAQKQVPRMDVRPKITHCTLINDDLIRRMKALDAIPATTPTAPTTITPSTYPPQLPVVSLVAIPGEPEFQTQNPVKFLAFNLPYVLIPLLLLIRMRKPLPFTRKF